MFGGSKAAKPQTRIDSLIGAETKIDGSIVFSGGLRIDGHIRGDVTGTGDGAGTLVVSEQAIVEGEIRVGHIVVNGTVKGPIYALSSLELQPKARISGDVFYDQIEIHVGAVVEGQLAHRKEVDARAAEPKLLTAASTDGQKTAAKS